MSISHYISCTECIKHTITININIHVYVYTYAYTYTHIYIYIYIYIYVCVCMYNMVQNTECILACLMSGPWASRLELGGWAWGGGTCVIINTQRLGLEACGWAGYWAWGPRAWGLRLMSRACARAWADQGLGSGTRPKPCPLAPDQAKYTTHNGCILIAIHVYIYIYI